MTHRRASDRDDGSPSRAAPAATSPRRGTGTAAWPACTS